jgi:hypothetical protein
MACRLAGSPTFRSPLSRKATTEGVVRLPSLLGITTGSLPSMTATHELVVPRSIPIIFPIIVVLLINVSLLFLFSDPAQSLPVKITGLSYNHLFSNPVPKIP